jgi:hypothetical protein
MFQKWAVVKVPVFWGVLISGSVYRHQRLQGSPLRMPRNLWQQVRICSSQDSLWFEPASSKVLFSECPEVSERKPGGILLRMSENLSQQARGILVRMPYNFRKQVRRYSLRMC